MTAETNENAAGGTQPTPLPGNKATETTNGVDLPRIERAVKEILAAVGEDPEREGLIETPGRVARMYAEMFSAFTASREHICRNFSPKNMTKWCWCATLVFAACANITCFLLSAKPTLVIYPTEKWSGSVNWHGSSMELPTDHKCKNV